MQKSWNKLGSPLGMGALRPGARIFGNVSAREVGFADRAGEMTGLQAKLDGLSRSGSQSEVGAQK